MAGSRQHFIPQMLLRCFSDDREQVRVLRRDGKSFVPSIKNIALEYEFYGKPGKGSADDSITQEETRIGAMLQELNLAPAGQIDSAKAAVIVAHFTVRVRGIREFMGQVANAAIDSIGQQFQDEDSCRSLLSDFMRDNPNFVVEEFQRKVREVHGVEALANLMQHPSYPSILNAINLAAKHHINSQNMTEFGEGLRTALSYIRSNVKGVVDRAHTKAALSDPTPAKRAELFSKFTFATQDTNQDLILGDSVCWGLSSSIGITPLYTIEDDLQVLVMPISRFRYILGWRDARPHISHEILALASVRASDDFIIAHPDVEDMAQFIGEFGKSKDTVLASLCSEK